MLTDSLPSLRNHFLLYFQFENLHLVFLQITSLRYSLHTIKSIHFNYTREQRLIRLQSCAYYHKLILEHFHHPEKKPGAHLRSLPIPIPIPR